ncbi:hypothetical protein CDAR_48791 [Caerostris darwini]|uniref:Uncharacterized protein n=1 Tax=Caerostris darwini TaxID=1538125 RepID=A0AAV4NKC0_9ARAC|nr:hypothetical protein CDAR_48791 [Caerostris darwini]
MFQPLAELKEKAISRSCVDNPSWPPAAPLKSNRATGKIIFRIMLGQSVNDHHLFLLQIPTLRRRTITRRNVPTSRRIESTRAPWGGNLCLRTLSWRGRQRHLNQLLEPFRNLNIGVGKEGRDCRWGRDSIFPPVGLFQAILQDFLNSWNGQQAVRGLLSGGGYLPSRGKREHAVAAHMHIYNSAYILAAAALNILWKF